MILPFADLSSLLVLLVLTGAVPVPLGTPPKPEDPAIAAVAPKKCLFYTSWSGRATPDPKSDNQTEQLLAEPEIVRLTETLDRFLEKAWGELSAPIAQNESEKKLYQALFAFGRTLFNESTAIYVERVQPSCDTPLIEGGLVSHMGDEAEKMKATLQDLLTRAAEAKEIELKEFNRDGLSGFKVKLKEFPSPIECGVKGPYLVVAVGEGGVAGFVRRLEGKPPAWLVQLKKQLTVARPATTTYINVKGLLETATASLQVAETPADRATTDGSRPKDMLAKYVRALGFDNVQYIAEVGGLDSEGYATKALMALDGPPRGLLQLVPDRPLRPEDLQPIPRDATYALAMRFDMQRAVEIVTSVTAQLHEAAGETPAANNTDIFGGLLEVDMRRQLLQSIGDTWCLYSSPGEGGLIITGLTFVAPLRNPSQFTPAFARLMTGLGQAVGGEAGGGVQRTAFNGRDIFSMPGSPVAWSMTDREFVAALMPQHVKAYLGQKDDHRSLATMPQVARQFSETSRPVILGYCDMPKLFELAYPILSMALVGAGMEGPDRFDISLLPSAPSIGRHLRPATLVVERTPAGIQIVNRGVLPKPGLAFTAATCVASYSQAGTGPVITRRKQELLETGPSELPPPPPVAPPAIR